MQLPPTILSLDDTKKNDKKKQKTTSLSQDSINPTTSSSKEAKDNKLSQAGDSNEGSDLESSSSEDGLPDGVAQMSISSRPLVPKLVPPRTLETTLFDRLEKMYGASIKQMLEIQYRYVPRSLHIGVV
jgi:DNA polymerase alpha-associated DNA helicase A